MPTAGYYRSARKLRAENALSEITSVPALKAAALVNLGVSASGGNLDSTFAIDNVTDPTKSIAFSASGNTAAKTLTLASAVTLDRTVTFPNASVTLASVTGTETLTNKTLTSPVMTAPALGVATGTSLAVTGLLKTSTPSAGFGFATGAGGTVTQASSRATTVVMVPNPCSCGSITTTADSLAALTIATFTVTNSAVAATDVVVVSKVSGDVDTHAWVNSVGSGSFAVSIRNSHATDADTTAFVLNFVVIKAVAA